MQCAHRIRHMFKDVAHGEGVEHVIRETCFRQIAHVDLKPKSFPGNPCGLSIRLDTYHIPAEALHLREERAITTTNIEQLLPPGSRQRHDAQKHQASDRPNGECDLPEQLWERPFHDAVVA